jgi:hypothetical protein
MYHLLLSIGCRTAAPKATQREAVVRPLFETKALQEQIMQSFWSGILWWKAFYFSFPTFELTASLTIKNYPLPVHSLDSFPCGRSGAVPFATHANFFINFGADVKWSSEFYGALVVASDFYSDAFVFMPLACECQKFDRVPIGCSIVTRRRAK